jgi:hypothetical protein
VVCGLSYRADGQDYTTKVTSTSARSDDDIVMLQEWMSAHPRHQAQTIFVDPADPRSVRLNDPVFERGFTPENALDIAARIFGLGTPGVLVLFVLRWRTRHQRREAMADDAALALARSPGSSTIADPPARSLIKLAGDRPSRSITLPRSDMGLSLLALLTAFAAQLWFVGLIAPGMHGSMRRDAGAVLAMMIPFYLAFLGFMVFAAAGVSRIEESSDSIVFRRRVLGIALPSRTLSKRAITAIEVRPLATKGKRSGYQLQITSQGRMLNIGSGRLSTADLDWLKQALSAMMRAS